MTVYLTFMLFNQRFQKFCDGTAEEGECIFRCHAFHLCIEQFNSAFGSGLRIEQKNYQNVAVSPGEVPYENYFAQFYRTAFGL